MKEFNEISYKEVDGDLNVVLENRDKDSDNYEINIPRQVLLGIVKDVRDTLYIYGTGVLENDVKIDEDGRVVFPKGMSSISKLLNKGSNNTIREVLESQGVPSELISSHSGEINDAVHVLTDNLISKGYELAKGKANKFTEKVDTEEEAAVEA